MRFKRIYPNTTGRTGASYFHSASLPVSELCVMSEAAFTTTSSLPLSLENCMLCDLLFLRFRFVWVYLNLHLHHIPKALFGFLHLNLNVVKSGLTKQNLSEVECYG